MLDLDWERSIPILNITIDELKSIFIEYDKTLIISDFNTIQIGCRNSNFVVNTNNGKFLLRITKSDAFNNEIFAYKLVKGKINIPSLLFHVMKDKINIFIYQYINGVSLQRYIFENNQCNLSLLEQVAKSSAIIHNIPKEKTIKLNKYNVPPFEKWYEYFLNNETVSTLLGEKICKRIRNLVLEKCKFISLIDSYQSFIHCDFRPANMIVDQYNKVFFVDWESASFGHSLADIGQFFRYRTFFNDTHINLFEQIYNDFSNKKLPDNWFELSIFRDLVNLLQILSTSKETPLRGADLINIIEKTLNYWGY